MRSTVLFIIILFSYGKLLASDSESKPDPIRLDIESLQSPSIPAFGILDLNPSSISRPLSPKEFRLSILSSVAESSSAVPGNIAIEFNPYWWKSREDVSFKELFFEPSISLSIRQSFIELFNCHSYSECTNRHGVNRCLFWRAIYTFSGQVVQSFIRIL